MEKNFYDFNDKSVNHTPVPRTRQWEQMPIPFDSKDKQKSKYDDNKIYNQMPTKRRKLTPQELIDLFWDKLVPLGWKDDEQSYVLTCPDCDHILKRIKKSELMQGEIDIPTHYFSRTRFQEHKTKCLTRREKEELDG